MIRVSDNAATNLLVSRLGMDRIDALARELGLRRTALRRRMMDFGALARGQENTTSASDMANLLAEIWGGSLLSWGARSFALESRVGQRLASGLPIGFPVGARYAHRTGELRGVERRGARLDAGPGPRAGRPCAGRRGAHVGARVVCYRDHDQSLGGVVEGDAAGATRTAVAGDYRLCTSVRTPPSLRVARVLKMGLYCAQTSLGLRRKTSGADWCSYVRSCGWGRMFLRVADAEVGEEKSWRSRE